MRSLSLRTYGGMDSSSFEDRAVQSGKTSWDWGATKTKCKRLPGRMGCAVDPLAAAYITSDSSTPWLPVTLEAALTVSASWGLSYLQPHANAPCLLRACCLATSCTAHRCRIKRRELLSAAPQNSWGLFASSNHNDKRFHQLRSSRDSGLRVILAVGLRYLSTST
jgi:hypothetical protein